MQNKLFIGGLAWGTREDTLQTFFEEIGEVVSAKVVMDRDTGRSRGFGFVEMATEELAKAALAFDGKELDGRVIHVSLARPQDRR